MGSRPESGNRKVFVRKGSLKDRSELLLANASNTNVILGSGVSGAIRQSCGSGFQTELTAALKNKFGESMPPGEVLLTNAGQHPRAKFIAHAAVMDYRSGGLDANSYPTVDTIRTCCRNLWRVIEEEVPSRVSIAIPALGAGAGNIGLRQSVEAICEELNTHLVSNPASDIGDVSFYSFLFPEYAIVADSVGLYFAIDDLPDDIRELVDAHRESRKTGAS